MGAAYFVGRVGGLAVALGVGVAVFNGVAVAGADAGTTDSDSKGASAAQSGSPNAGPARTRRAGAANAAAATKSIKRSVGAPAAGKAVGVIATATSAGSGGTRTGSLPVGDLAASAALAVSRRHPSAAVTHSATASSTASSTASTAISVTSGVTFDDGIINATLDATSAAGNTLTYTVQGSSCGTGCGVGSSGGKMTAVTPTGSTQNYAILPYANWLDGTAKGTQTFQVRVTETTQFDQIITSIPLIGMLASPIIGLLQKTPFLGDLLAPIIGSTVLVDITADVATLAPADTPLAYTYKVVSFDGAKISTNFFPASGLVAGQTAYTVLNGPGLGGAGTTDPYATNSAAGSSPGVVLLRNAQTVGDVAYNVITWDPRGEFQSEGILQLDNPFYEGRDVSALIDWAADFTPATLNGTGDPALGMVGGSYGGGIQLATVDPRLDALVPAINWNSLNEALYPDTVFKTAWANTLALSLLTTGARINTQIYSALLTGDLLGWISESAQAVLGSSGPTALLNQLQAPTLLVQGIVDALFPLVQSIENAEDILANPFGTPVKMIWFCGGHGVCLDPVDLTAQAETIFSYDKAWLNKYVSGVPIPDAFTPTFQWWDQLGDRYTSDLYPFSDGFNTDTPLEGVSTGGVLGILPFGIGGSGPNSSFSFPLNQVFATEAGNAINVPITPTTGQQVVGAPTVSFTYSGFGTSRAVYGQIVDNTTGRVLGNVATPIPVILDGQTRTVSVPLADIAYTAGDTPSLTLQIASSATLYWNSSWGVMNISDVQAALPIRA